MNMNFMKRITACFLALVLLAASAFAAKNEKEQERVKEAGEVLKEILNIPDDIPPGSARQGRVCDHIALCDKGSDRVGAVTAAA
jgi:hypothetical protein